MIGTVLMALPRRPQFLPRSVALCPRKHSVTHGCQRWNVFCFKEEADARKFMNKFSGEKFDPAQRGKGRNGVQGNK
jgi:hypothetical protein